MSDGHQHLQGDGSLQVTSVPDSPRSSSPGVEFLHSHRYAAGNTVARFVLKG